MSEVTLVFLWLAISIIVILVSIIKLKLNPVIGLILGSLVMGFGTGLGGVATIKAIGAGFGGLLGAIGIPIGLGVILGKLLEVSGGARVIAETLVKKTSEKYSLYALGFAAFLISIPVFFDITFIILIPLAIEVSRTLKKPVPYAIGAITIGAAGAHTLVPPTPNPLAAASILNFDLGVMFLVGALVAFVACAVSWFVYFKILDKGFWNKENDEAEVLDIQEVSDLPNGAPSFGLSMLPLLLPVFCILLNTISNAMGFESRLISFLSSRVIAMLLGTLAAYLISQKSLKGKIDKVANEAVATSGIVLLITGAGGSFGTVIKATGFADALANSFNTVGASPLLIVLVAFGLAVVFRIALGSGTVASITTMNIMASFTALTTLHPVFIALACLAGGISIGHINDSGFWVVTNLSGYTVRGGLKSYTIGGAFISIITITVCIVASLFYL